MSKNNKKNTNDAKKKKVDLVSSIKAQLDPNRIRFNSENTNRTSDIVKAVSGVLILGITAVTMLLPVSSDYPFNLSYSSSVKDSIDKADTKRENLEQVINEAVQYGESVESDKLLMDEHLYSYLPNSLDSLSFMVYVEEIAKKNNVTIKSMLLPEEQEAKKAEEELVDNKVAESSGSSLLGESLVSDEESLEEKPKQEKKQLSDFSYKMQIVATGKYTNLAKFFGELENTREIIGVSDFVISEFEDVKYDSNGKVIPNNEKKVINLNNFDMNSIETQISFTANLYNRDLFEQYVSSSMKKGTDSGLLGEDATNGGTK